MMKSLFLGHQANKHQEGTLGHLAWQSQGSTVGKFTRELESFALEIDDPDLRAMLSSDSSGVKNILDSYADTAPRAATPPAGISGFSVDSNKQKFVVSYKTPILKKVAEESIGGQSVGNVRHMSNSLDNEEEEVSDSEIMSALGVVVRQTVQDRIRARALDHRNAMRGYGYDPQAPWRRRLKEEDVFTSDFQISLHMDIIECDGSQNNPLFAPFQRLSANTGYKLLSEECKELLEAFRNDNLVDAVYEDEEISGQADYPVDERVRQQRVNAVLHAANQLNVNDDLNNQQWLHKSPETGINSAPLFREWADSPPPFVSDSSQGPIVVAVIDSGVDYLHKDLVGSIWQNPGETCNDGEDNDGNGFVDDCYGWNFVDNSNNPMDDNGHGTGAAGLIAATPNNTFGITPVCFNCVVLAIKVLDKDIKGTVSGFVRAINYALLAGARISNNSYGGQNSRFGSLEDAVRRAEKRGMIFVAASGNFSCNADEDPAYPASYGFNNIVSVASHGASGDLSDFSCYGRRSVHLSAPGESVLTLDLNNSFTRVNGTSFAAPVVAGVLGMVLNEDPEITSLKALDILYQSARPSNKLMGKTITGGMVDLHRALELTRRQAPGRQPTRQPSNGSGGRPTRPTPRPSEPSEPTAPTFDITFCHHDVCPHRALCISVEDNKRKLNHPSINPRVTYGPELMACKCNAGQVLVPDEAPPEYPWAGDIGYCKDVNECAVSNPCQMKSELDKFRVQCVNKPGGYDCRCQPGFTDISTVPGEVRCIDIDECQLNANICPMDMRGGRAQCLNLPGNHECLCPHRDQYWDGVSNRCQWSDRASLQQCKDARTQVWSLDQCRCRVGYAFNQKDTSVCVRTGVLEAVDSGIYQRLVEKKVDERRY